MMTVKVMFRKIFAKEEKPIKKESSFEKNENEKAIEDRILSSKRTAVFPCIAAWISQRNQLYQDRKIYWWQFADCSFENIDFCFLGEPEVRRGHSNAINVLADLSNDPNIPMESWSAIMQILADLESILKDVTN